MIPTTEVRWFLAIQVSVSPALFEGRDSSDRTDRYARVGPRSAVKIREGNVDIKLLEEACGTRDFGGVSGRLECWRKWVFQGHTDAAHIDAALATDEWVSVQKRRWLLPFEMQGGRLVQAVEWPETGCHVEWTILSVLGQDWLTVGLEAFGAMEDQEDLLMQTADLVMPELAAHLSLDESNSMSYPQWLHTLTDHRP
jgi:hypothetical protein